jgi:4-hydroxyphenylpyruvate dioxygenase
VIRNQNTVFVFCSVYGPKESEEFNQHMIKHGDGVKDIAFLVEDAKAIYEHAIAHGAGSVYPPK